MDNVLTRDECELVLRNYFQKTECVLTSYTIHSLSDTVEGFIGEHYVLRIQFGDENLRFFLKVLNGRSKVIFKLSESLNAYAKEAFFYTYLQKEFAESGIDLTYAPKPYLCKPYKIVLEDLSTRGYKSAPKGEFFDLAHCEAGLRTLVKFHTSGVLYERLAGLRLNAEFPECFEEKLFNNGNDLPNKWLDCSFVGLLSVIDYMDLSDDRKLTIKEQMKVLKDGIFEIIRPKDGETNMMIHGDLWANNFLFKYQDSKPCDSILIDYQILKYGNPAIDVIQFIMSNTRKVFRDEYYSHLLDFYYGAFAGRLLEKGMDSREIMKRGSFLDACDSLKAAVKFQSIADRSTTLLSDECFVEAMLTDDSLNAFLFEDRAQGIIDSYRNNDIFREIITEDLLELFDMLPTI